MTVSVRFDVFQGELRNLLESEQGPVARDLAKRANRCQGAARRLCPVDTGRLRASIGWRLEHDGRGLVAYVGTNVKYAAYVEFGTRYTRAQPFLRPALEEATRR